MSPQIACMNPCWLHLIFLHYVFSNVSSLWEYFDLQGPWQKVLTDLKKSLYTLQADPEKSRDFIIKNPGILINWKSRDPGIPGIPLGPALGRRLLEQYFAEVESRPIAALAENCSSHIWQKCGYWQLVLTVMIGPMCTWGPIIGVSVREDLLMT